MKIENENGYILFHQEHEELIIDELFVNPESRGNRAGYKLLNEVKSYAFEHHEDEGIETISLCAYPQEKGGITQNALIDYYRDFGFEQFEGTEIMNYEVY